MSEFTFETTPRVICRDGSAAELAQFARELGVQRALLVTDDGVMSSGIADEALSGFRGRGGDVSLRQVGGANVGDRDRRGARWATT
jgi:alcohol dehydrogenase class IV